MTRKQILTLIPVIFLLNLSNLFSQEGLELSRKDSAEIKKLETGYLHYDSIGNIKETTRCLNAIGMLYWEHNQNTNAVNTYLKSLERNKKLGNENAVAMINNNLGALYSDLGNYTESEKCFRETLKYRRTQKKGQNESLTACLINLSQVLLKTKKYDEAANVMLEAVDYAKSVNEIQRMVSCYGTLAEIYAKKGDKKKEKQYFEEYVKYNDILTKRVHQQYLNEKDRAKLAEFEKLKKENELLLKNQELEKTEIELEKTEMELNLNKSVSRKRLERLKKEQLITENLEKEAKIKKLQEEEIAGKLRNLIIIFSLSSLFMVIVGIIIFRAYKQKQKANNELAQKNHEIKKQNEEIKHQSDNLNKAYTTIEQKNEKILEGIEYASMIQNAMLTKAHDLNDLVSDSFIYYLPRDTVSGDFYWYTIKNDKIIISAIDCTGHGVPGALLSMIGNDLLNKIVIHDCVTSPEKILKEMDKGVIAALNQEESEMNDGMDIAICTIDKKNNKLQFAGANNPLFLVQNGELKRIRGDFFAIGKDQFIKKEKKFKLNEFDLTNDTSFYILSDGYTDQNTGEDFKKFGIKQFEELVGKIHTQTMDKQLKTITETHENWKGENEQLDDIVVLGIKV